MSDPDESVAAELAFLNSLFESDEIGVRVEPEWTGNPDELPDGPDAALQENIRLSKRFAGVEGTAVDPKTGRTQPRKNLLMRAAAAAEDDD